jgi:hypothetical protein
MPADTDFYSTAAKDLTREIWRHGQWVLASY